jgi:ankyrin repeat protein
MCESVRWLQGPSPLLLAAEQGSAEVMRALIEAKADQTAMRHGSTTAVELLLRATAVKQGNAAHAISVSGADVNVRNKVRSCAERPTVRAAAQSQWDRWIEVQRLDGVDWMEPPWRGLARG